MKTLFFFALFAASSLGPVVIKAYSLVDNIVGSGFFNAFDWEEKMRQDASFFDLFFYLFF